MLLLKCRPVVRKQWLGRRVLDKDERGLVVKKQMPRTLNVQDV